MLATTLPAADIVPNGPAGFPQPRQLKTVSLNDADALARLRQSNPRHYQIVRRVIAAASELCEASKGTPMKMKLAVQDLHCAQAWYTSNPPKRELDFTIEDTTYSALIVMADSRGTLKPIR